MGNGRAEALARTAGAAPAGRWPTMTLEGSTATTVAVVSRLVRAGAGADVHDDPAPVTDLLVDQRLPARVGPAMGDVARPMVS